MVPGVNEQDQREDGLAHMPEMKILHHTDDLSLNPHEPDTFTHGVFQVHQFDSRFIDNEVGNIRLMGPGKIPTFPEFHTKGIQVVMFGHNESH